MNCKKVTAYIVDWLKNYKENSSSKAFIIGLSGGIDSAVTSTLCALTQLPIICVEIPIDQEEDQSNRAKEHMEWLKNKFRNVQTQEIELTEIFKNLKKTLPLCSEEGLSNLSSANTKSRLRMITLYHLSCINEGLVVGTGNKVEDFGIGFFTKYGDGGVDLNPIADLVKREVFMLGKYLKIPFSIQTSTPTDGLFANSPSDEQQIGASYDELEWAMNQNEKNREVFTERQKEVYAIYKTRSDANQHKMQAIPFCKIPDEWKE